MKTKKANGSSKGKTPKKKKVPTMKKTEKKGKLSVQTFKEQASSFPH